MKKVERQARAARRQAIRKQNELQETAMLAFIEECRKHLSKDKWDHYYSDAVSLAGNTWHIVEYLVFALVETQVPILPKLRKSLEHVLETCDVDRERWTELRLLNFDSYWRKQYGYE